MTWNTVALVIGWCVLGFIGLCTIAFVIAVVHNIVKKKACSTCLVRVDRAALSHHGRCDRCEDAAREIRRARR